ncbi:sensor domain-containing diguanylate cyclase [Thiohalorhabdus sp. Cl-TMA]|uniref:Diguanylate cyclase n=1 Tax=Thiohalorhabdus methylotrophus TaxID=3242694 RepID=A0ABV4TVR0_9GAMM
MDNNRRTQLLEAAVEQSFNPVVITTAQLELPGPQILYVNTAFTRMTGYTTEEVYGRTPRILQGPETDHSVIQRLRDRLWNGQSFQGTTINYRKDGSSYWVEWNISPIRDEAGEIRNFVSVQRDITDQVMAERERRLLATALDANADNVLITDRSGAITYVNQAFVRQTGYPLKDIRGQQPSILKSGEHGPEFYRRLWETIQDGGTFQATFTDRSRDGTRFHMEQTITPVRDERGEVTHYVATGKDITERVKMEQALEEMATTDLLTGLPNRSHGEQLLDRQWNRTERYAEAFSVIMADVDHFKAVNDRHGHDAGDRILSWVAGALRSQLRDSDTAIRWGGEEFLILAPHTGLEGAEELAERMRTAVAGHEDPEVGSVTLSLGVATLREGDTKKRLIKRADSALYAAKEAGRNRVSSV